MRTQRTFWFVCFELWMKKYSDGTKPCLVVGRIHDAIIPQEMSTFSKGGPDTKICIRWYQNYVQWNSIGVACNQVGMWKCLIHCCDVTYHWRWTNLTVRDTYLSEMARVWRLQTPVLVNSWDGYHRLPYRFLGSGRTSEVAEPCPR